MHLPFRRRRSAALAAVVACLGLSASGVVKAQSAGPPPGAATPTAPSSTADAPAPAEQAGPGTEAAPADAMPAELPASEDPDVPTAGLATEAGDPPGGTSTSVPMVFVGLWVGPDDADLGFSSEERIRAALSQPPFALRDAPSSPISPDCVQTRACRKEKLSNFPGSWVVVGAIDAEGTQTTLRLMLVEASSGRRTAGASVVETSNDDGKARLLQSVQPLVEALVQTLDPGAGPAVPADLVLEDGPAVAEADDPEAFPVPEDETRARLWPEEEEAEAAEENRRLSAKKAAEEPAPKVATPDAAGGINYAAWAWSGGFLGAGAVMALGGIGFDLFSPTSVDDELSPLDGVGPGLVLLGAGVALVGLVVNPFLWLDLAGEEGDDDAAS